MEKYIPKEWKAKAAPYRSSTRRILDSLCCEVLVMIMVMAYAIIIFVDLAVTVSQDDSDSDSPGEDTFHTLDQVFLTVFLVEIMTRLFAFGEIYLHDLFNAIDAVVVFVSFILAMMPRSLTSKIALLKLLRIIRLFRFAVVVNKLQRSRESAALHSKRMVYRRMGAPAEKVLAFLEDFCSRLAKKKDQDNLRWMMEMIANEELYKMGDIDEETLEGQGGAGGGSTATDMRRWLTDETGLKERKGSFVGNAADQRGLAALQGDVGTSTHTGVGAGLWAEQLLCDKRVASLLQDFDSTITWGFDIFEFDLACVEARGPEQSRPAALLTYAILDRYGTIDALSLDRNALLQWLSAVEAQYDRKNPYHNALHAADVVASLHYFLQLPNLQRQVQPIDVLAALVSALVHDAGHQGLNNKFLETTQSVLAVTYNDISVLENHHVATAFRLLGEEGNDWTRRLTEEQFRDFRDTMIQMVLGTDMKAHFDHLNKFKSKMAGEGFGEEQLDRKDVRLVLLMALHAADVCNPSQPRELAMEWAWRVSEEFFLQGDREAELGLAISPFMDRRKESVSRTIVNCQVGFINVLVRPFFEEWLMFLGDAAERYHLERDIMTPLAANLRLLENDGVALFDNCVALTAAQPGNADSLASWGKRRSLFASGGLSSSVPTAKV